MSPIEFNKCLMPLVEIFGEKKYPEALTRILYLKFKDLPVDFFTKVCNKLAVCEKFAPRYNEFYAQVAEKLREVAEARKNSNKIDCSHCRGEGVLFYFYQIGRAEVAGRCWCRNGEMFYSGLPEMNRKAYVENKPEGERLRDEYIEKLSGRKIRNVTDGFKDLRELNKVRGIN